MKKRIKHFVIIILIIATWLASRNISWIPYFFWDILRWMMVYFIIKLLYKNNKKVLIFSFIFCFWIEFSQLIDIDFLNNLRDNKYWKLLLGQWFLFSDLIYYSFWILISYLSEWLKLNKKPAF
jgi:hypothetical protein